MANLVCQNCQFDQNLPNSAFCSRCGAPMSCNQAAYQAPPMAQAVPMQQAQYPGGQPQYVAQGVPVQARPEYVVVQPAPVVGQVLVVPGQMLTVDGYCAHAVQSNDFTLCGIVLGILFFPAENCQFDQNLPNSAFCSRCGAPTASKQAGYQPPAESHVVQIQQPHYQGGQQNQGQSAHVILPPTAIGGQVMVVPGQTLTAGGHCAHSVQSDDFTCCGICLGILCFPIGILCCLLMRERKCVHCGASIS
ncbi:hypothetical protein ACHHYP_06245 [Achlya hypogyna]|uniref:Membrane protein BRI3 n=1 Tax=Achlya hypogyna TaxID=1202772 RepID=A0A1V9YUV4_ACHHY|nr:hypothetical protein ACHHYP_06245 [Achlya hypogyna]